MIKLYDLIDRPNELMTQSDQMPATNNLKQKKTVSVFMLASHVNLSASSNSLHLILGAAAFVMLSEIAYGCYLQIYQTPE